MRLFSKKLVISLDDITDEITGNPNTDTTSDPAQQLGNIFSVFFVTPPDGRLKARRKFSKNFFERIPPQEILFAGYDPNKFACLFFR